MFIVQWSYNAELINLLEILRIKRLKGADSVLTDEKAITNGLFTLVILLKELGINKKTIQRDME